MTEIRELSSLESRPTHRQALSDARLVELVRRGERSAYEEIVRRYEKKLLRTLYRMVGNVETAEDLAQDTFLKGYDRLEQFDVGKRFGPWLFQIGVNAAIDWLRRHRRHQPISLSAMSQEGREFDVAEPDPRPSEELRQEVHHVIEQLPEAYRTVLLLRDVEGFPCSEVAAIVGRREPTVRWRLARAREMFRDIWDRRQEKKG